jgi:hypothetical protein
VLLFISNKFGHGDIQKKLFKKTFTNENEASEAEAPSPDDQLEQHTQSHYPWLC